MNHPANDLSKGIGFLLIFGFGLLTLPFVLIGIAVNVVMKARKRKLAEGGSK